MDEELTTLTTGTGTTDEGINSVQETLGLDLTKDNFYDIITGFTTQYTTKNFGEKAELIGKFNNTLLDHLYEEADKSFNAQTKVGGSCPCVKDVDENDTVDEDDEEEGGGQSDPMLKLVSLGAKISPI